MATRLRNQRPYLRLTYVQTQKVFVFSVCLDSCVSAPQEQDEAARLRRQLSEARANTEREYLDLEEQLAEAERSRAAARAEMEHMEEAAAVAREEWEQQVGGVDQWSRFCRCGGVGGGHMWGRVWWGGGVGWGEDTCGRGGYMWQGWCWLLV